jgi:polar amino acid transport system substrate-binding protein
MVSLIVLAVSCGADDGSGQDAAPAAASATGDPSSDKLAQILARGTLVLSTDPEYPPQSYPVQGAVRPPDTKCTADQMTGDEMTGYDAETGKLVAEALGVEPCFVVPQWTQITSGNWGDRWDISYGSGSINEERMEFLWMTQPYYAVPNVYFVHEDSKFETPDDLAGKRIGACASCSHEFYLRGELEIPGVDIVVNVEDPEVAVVRGEADGLEAVAKGKMDAFLAALPVGQALIDDGLPLRPLDEIAFTYYPSGFVDKGSGLDSAAFVDRVNEIIRSAQADGTLGALSEEFFGTDYATAASEFDLDAIGQGEID